MLCVAATFSVSNNVIVEKLSKRATENMDGDKENVVQQTDDAVNG